MKKIWNFIKNLFVTPEPVEELVELVDEEQYVEECDCNECECDGTCECVTCNDCEEDNDSSIHCVELETNENNETVENQFVNLQDASRKLAFLLRHDKDYDFPSNGYRTVENLVTECGYTLTELEEIVSTDEKGRYEFNDDHTMIRATQGHSVMVDVGFKETVPPVFLYHGTSDRFIDSIMKNGIQKMSRQYVQLSFDIATAKKVGARHGGKTLVLRIFAHDMYKDGFKFYLSVNGVWNIDEVPSFPCQYFEIVSED